MDQREQLQAILKTHQQGNLTQALAEYQKLLQEAPACADAHHLLGLCQLELGLLEAASASLSHAARLADKVAEFHADACAAEAACGRWPAARDSLQTARRRGLRIAERLHALGLKNLRQLEFNEAIACFELECDVVPRAAAHHNLAIALLHVDRLAEAERALNNTIQLDPNFLFAYKNRALLRERLHDHSSALADWLKATQLNPNDVDLWLHRAQCHTQLQQNEEALRTLEHAVALDPKRAAAWNNLGVALQRLGKTARATDCFQKAIKADSKLTDAHFNLGSTLALLKQWAKAAEYFSTACHQQPDNAQYQRRLATCWSELRNWSEAEDVIARAVALQPLDGEFRAQMGEIVQHRGDIELALPHFAEAVRLNPSQPLAWAKLGLAAKRLGDADMARTAFAKLTELEGSDEARYLHAISLPVIYRDEQDLVQRRQQLEVDIDGLLARGVRLDATKLVLNTTFLLAYQGYNDRPLQEKSARLWIDQREWPGHCCPSSNDSTFPDKNVRASTLSSKIRVGFLSSLLKYHTIGKLARGWIKELNREKFEVVVLSPYHHEDQGAEWIRSAADQYVSLSHNLSEAAERVLEQQLDVLIYPEIGMDPLTMSLARRRLAPVQCTTWGHPVTSGLPTIDYFLSSRLIEPSSAADHYSEQLIQFETLPAYYYRPRLPNRERSRGDLGLSDDANIYLCPHTLFKMHPQFDNVLRSILQHDPQGLLVLIDGRFQRWRKELSERFARTLGEFNQRVRFLPNLAHPEYMRLLELSDVLLDLHHFGGGNTHYEAFSVGLPVVTRPSELMRGRVAYGLFQKMGYDSCIAGSDEQYVEIALRLANDKQLAHRVREEILARSAAIYQDTQSVRELETFLGSVARKSLPVQRRTDKPSRPANIEQQPQENVRPNLSRTLRSCTCPACGHHVAAAFFNPGALPLATLAWPSTSVEALAMKRLPHDFVRCVDCGHVYNAAFQYDEVPYSTKPNLMFNRGALWQEHLQNVKQTLLSGLPAAATVVEIGCGEGHLLRALASARPDGNYIGFDPNAQVDTGHGAFQARRELFDPAIHLAECRPHLLISRHVLEHLMNPNGFIQALSFAVSCTGQSTSLFIEVPCIDHVLQLGRTVDFFYEHHSHFTTTSLEKMLRRSATNVQCVSTAYNGEVAYALARFQPRDEQMKHAREALEFSRRAARNRSRMRQQLDALQRSGRRIAIWGGTGKAAAFIQQNGIDGERFPLVVDSDPDKAGTFVPGSGQQIQFRDCLLSHPVSVIVIATQWRAADIVLEILRCGISYETVLLEHDGQLVDYFRDDHPYHAPQKTRVGAPVVDGPHFAGWVSDPTSLGFEASKN